MYFYEMPPLHVEPPFARGPRGQVAVGQQGVPVYKSSSFGAAGSCSIPVLAEPCAGDEVPRELS